MEYHGIPLNSMVLGALSRGQRVPLGVPGGPREYFSNSAEFLKIRARAEPAPHLARDPGQVWGGPGSAPHLARIPGQVWGRLRPRPNFEKFCRIAEIFPRPPRNPKGYPLPAGKGPQNHGIQWNSMIFHWDPSDAPIK